MAKVTIDTEVIKNASNTLDNAVLELFPNIEYLEYLRSLLQDNLDVLDKANPEDWEILVESEAIKRNLHIFDRLSFYILKEIKALEDTLNTITVDLSTAVKSEYAETV